MTQGRAAVVFKFHKDSAFFFSRSHLALMQNPKYWKVLPFLIF